MMPPPSGLAVLVLIRRWIYPLLWLWAAPLPAAVYHLDSVSGRDGQDGLTPGSAWQSLARVGETKLAAGDRLRLKRGSLFSGTLRIEARGTAEAPVLIETYGEGCLPVIDARGFWAGVEVGDSTQVEVRDLEITADGGEPRDGADPRQRFGVLVHARDQRGNTHVTLKNLYIHDVYPAEPSGHEGARATSYLGTAIAIRGGGKERSSHFLVEGCRIERTGFKAIDLSQIQLVRIIGNTMKDIGGPAIQPGQVEDLVVRGNVVDGSGSSLDPRMHARGSGIWPWTSKRVLIEKNRFMHARGKADSCGIHIDFNCEDVVVQYNLSQDNEGGFIEILGNNRNCAYRYNISINDGARVKGVNGADQEGKVLWTSGYVGSKRPRSGPFNSYIYNNTIYVGPDSRSCFSIAPTTDGLLIANNIFQVMGRTQLVAGDQERRTERQGGSLARKVFRNNLYISATVLPTGLPFADENPIFGDPHFIHAGGLKAEDYIPTNADLVRDRGVEITRLAGDAIGLRLGLRVATDFLGNPVTGVPDLGAIELPVVTK